MKRTIKALVTVATVGVVLGGAGVALAQTSPTAPATPAAGQASTLSAGMVDAMKRDLGVSGDALRQRLAAEAAAPLVERRLRTELATTYGGAWMAPDGHGLIVGVTDQASAAKVRAAGAEPQLVAQSARDLDTTKATLDKHAKAAGNAIHSWYVDPATNSVVVQATGQAAAKDFIKASGATSVRVEIKDAEHAYQPVNDVRGGDEFVTNLNNGYIAFCSVGFAVSGGFVSAGHCGKAGMVTSGAGIDQGTYQASTFPGNDWSWIKVNSSWTPRPLVNNYAGGTVSVAGSNEAAVGSSVCRSGRTSGWHCGTVQAKNVTVNYSGEYVYGLTDTTACAEPGDSGGSFISGDQAQGVTSGGAGTCSTGGTSLFQPVNPILSTYGLSLVTTGGSTSRIIGYQGKCIDVPSGIAADGTQLQMWTCNNTNAQNWTFGSDGTLRALGMCMDVAWGSTADGAVVQLANCSGNPAQQWVLSAAGDLVNPQANKCVDVKDWNTADGAKLQTWTCAGTANQKWYRG